MLPESKTSEGKLSAPKIVAQVGFYLLIGLFIGYFSFAPTYQYTDGEQVELKFVVRHSGVLIGECRDLTAAEMDKLPANMKRTQICPREKAPLDVVLLVNDDQLLKASIQPSGLQNDGVLALYKNFILPAGQLVVQFTIEGGEAFSQTIEVDPGGVILLQYDDRGFHLRLAGKDPA
jgi:hypothetical protein